jgi:chemotaxis signal transduction protein
MQRLVLFHVGDNQFGIDMAVTRSIETAGRLLGEQPGAADKRSLTVDGEEVPLFDLSTMLGGATSSCDPQGRKVMLVRSGGHHVALIVDRVDRVTEVGSGRIAPLPPVFRGPALAWFPRVLMQEDRLVLVLSPEGIADAASPEQIAEHSRPMERVERCEETV